MSAPSHELSTFSFSLPPSTPLYPSPKNPHTSTSKLAPPREHIFHKVPLHLPLFFCISIFLSACLLPSERSVSFSRQPMQKVRGDVFSLCLTGSFHPAPPHAPSPSPAPPSATHPCLCLVERQHPTFSWREVRGIRVMRNFQRAIIVLKKTKLS